MGEIGSLSQLAVMRKECERWVVLKEPKKKKKMAAHENWNVKVELSEVSQSFNYKWVYNGPIYNLFILTFLFCKFIMIAREI